MRTTRRRALQGPVRSIIRPVAGLALLLGLGAAGAPPAGAQGLEVPVELSETRFAGPGARALGMGLAMQAVTGDATSLAYNPATLADLRRGAVSGGLAHRSTEWTLQRGDTGVTDRGRTTFDHAMAAFPVPVQTGTLTWGVGVYQLADVAQDVFLQSTIRPAQGGAPELQEVDLFEQSGGLWAWGGGVGWEISPRVSVGASLAFLTGDRRQTSITAHGIPVPVGAGGDQFGLRYDCVGDGESDCFRDETRLDLSASGFTGSLGFVARMGDHVRLGGTFTLPRWITYEGWLDNSFEDFIGPFPDTSLAIRDEITLPLSLAGGVAVHGDLGQVALDLKWTDWTQIDFEGPVRAPDRSPAYRSTVEVHLGGELVLPRSPVRLRAGAMYIPTPYRLIAADTELVFDSGDDGQAGTGDDVSYVERQYPEADIDDRWMITLGLGLELDPAFTLDVAYAWGSMERSSVSSYSPTYGNPTVESVDRGHLALTGVVRF